MTDMTYKIYLLLFCLYQFSGSYSYDRINPIQARTSYLKKKFKIIPTNFTWQFYCDHKPDDTLVKEVRHTADLSSCCLISSFASQLRPAEQQSLLQKSDLFRPL